MENVFMDTNPNEFVVLCHSEKPCFLAVRKENSHVMGKICAEEVLDMFLFMHCTWTRRILYFSTFQM